MISPSHVELNLQDAAKAIDEVREARAAQRHAELWLEKSLAEVDAVHAILEYSDHTSGSAITPIGAPAAPSDTTVAVSHLAQTPRPPSPDYVRTRHQHQQQQTHGVEEDAAQSILEHSDHTTAPAISPVDAPGAPSAMSASVPRLAQTPRPPSPDYMRTRHQEQEQQQTHGVVAPSAQTPYPPSPSVTAKEAAGYGSEKVNFGMTGRGLSASAMWSQSSPLGTPDHHDVTIPRAFVAPSHLGSSGGTIRDWKDDHDCSLTMGGEVEEDAGTRAREANRPRFDTSSPSTPKVLFQDIATDRRGGSARGRCRNEKVPWSSGKGHLPLNGDAGHEVDLHATFDAILATGGGEHPVNHKLDVRDFSNSNASLDMKGSAPATAATAAAANRRPPGAGDKDLASLLRWHSFFLRYEMSRREKAEARAAELEVQAKHVALEKVAASEGAPTNDPRGPPVTGETERTADINLSSSGGGAWGGDIADDTRQCRDCGARGVGEHHSLTLPGATFTSINGVTADCYAHFARVDLERQKGKILDLVGEARSRMMGTALENKMMGDGNLPSRLEKGATINGGKRGGRGPSTEEGCVMSVPLRVFN